MNASTVIQPWQRARGTFGLPVMLSVLADATVFLIAFSAWGALAGVLAAGLLWTLIWAPRRYRIGSFKVDLYDHVKDDTRVEQYMAHKARRRQWLVDLFQLDLDSLVTEPGGRRGDVKPARVSKWVRIRGVPFALRPQLHDLRAPGVLLAVRWTPLVPYPDSEFFEDLALRVAHFLAVEPQTVIWNPPDLRSKWVSFRAADPSSASDYQRLYSTYNTHFKEEQ